MEKPIFLFLLFLCWSAASGQHHLPTIKANSTKVDIQVGDDYFLKNGWMLEPDKKPDIFTIGSKWNYEFKKVSFITDVDSISFRVSPGNKYDFIILLHQNTLCYIRIVTLPNPVFMDLRIIIPICIGFIIVLFFLYVRRDKINVLQLLNFGYASPLLFWLTVFVSGYIHGDYNHLKNVISELGAIGTKSEIITSTSLLLVAFFSVLFSSGFYKASKKLNVSTVPAILSLTMPFTMIWAAIFTLGNEFHSLTGPLPLLIIVGSLLAFLLWQRRKEFLVLRTLSLLSFFIMMLISLRFIKTFGHEYEGLVQRFFYIGWTIWTMTITYFFSKNLR